MVLDHVVLPVIESPVTFDLLGCVVLIPDVHSCVVRKITYGEVAELLGKGLVIGFDIQITTRLMDGSIETGALHSFSHVSFILICSFFWCCVSLQEAFNDFVFALTFGGDGVPVLPLDR